MRCEIYDPEVTTSVVVNTYDNPAGLGYVGDTSMAYWQGKFVYVLAGVVGSYVENGGELQAKIWMATSNDGEVWEAPFTPFRDAAYCTNPLATTPDEAQPNLVVVGTELWCLWSTGADTFISKLASPQGKWTNYRFEFVNDKPYLSNTLTGAGVSGRTRKPAVAGLDDWLMFPASDPIVLSSGVVACPVTLLSMGHVSSQIDTANGFIKAIKMNALALCDDGDWSLTVVDPGVWGDFSSWEPFVYENPVGHIYLISRNINPNSAGVDKQLVARSTDGGKSFTASASMKMQVPSSRGSARKVGASRWIMTHCDRPSDGGNNDRVNGALFVSRRGLDDFVPGVQFSDFAAYVKYPQLIAANNAMYVNLSTGAAMSDKIGVGRAVARVMKVAPIPADDVAYVHPRSSSLYAGGSSDPKLVTGTPPYYEFNGVTDRLTSSATAATSAGMTYVAWVRHDYDPPWNAALVDIRSGLSGSLFRVSGNGLGSCEIYHGFDMPIATDIFVASVIDHSAMTVTAYIAYGQSDFITKTSYFKSLLFSGQPADAETVTVDGTVFTFKSTPTLTNHVQIGASTAATVANLRTKINTAMGTGNNASTLIADTRLVVARTDGTSFAVSSGASNVAVESSIDLSGGSAHFGAKRPGSSVSNYHGRIYDARIYNSALTAANMRSLYNARRAEFGYSTAIGGISTAPTSPLLRVDPANPDAVAFPSVGQAHCCEVITDQLRIHGEGSASVEQPYGANDVTIRYKLSATPASTDKYVIASFGVASSPVRLYINGANPKNLYLNGILVGTVTDPTAWNTITVTVATNKAVVGGVDYYYEGKPRCYLGNAWPETLLAASKNTDYDVPAMTVSRA